MQEAGGCRRIEKLYFETICYPHPPTLKYAKLTLMKFIFTILIANNALKYFGA
jgi:hypothetical protein